MSLLPSPRALLLLPLAAASAAAVAGCGPEVCPEVPGLDEALCEQVRSLALPAELPAARGNAVADDEAAALLGRVIFFDARFSANLDVRCASCHAPELAFTDRVPRSDKGLGPVPRNSPTTLNAARGTWQFWDGRADSLWSQPLFALEAENEMGVTRLEVAHQVWASLREPYEAIFGPLPDLQAAGRFPPRGKPGDEAFDAMAPADQEAVNLVFARVGKALEAYMRRSTTGPSPLDEYLGGDGAALDDEQRAGLGVFARAGCLSCHSGPMLSDGTFSNLGVPDLPGEPPDRGRAEGALVLAENLFSLAGPFADEPHPHIVTPAALREEARSPKALGAFLVPSLRGVAKTAPYGHNGAFPTLADVVEHHLAGGAAAGSLGELDPRLSATTLTSEEELALLAFLGALTGEGPPPPWDGWPDR